MCLVDLRPTILCRGAGSLSDENDTDAVSHFTTYYYASDLMACRHLLRRLG